MGGPGDSGGAEGVAAKRDLRHAVRQQGLDGEDDSENESGVDASTPGNALEGIEIQRAPIINVLVAFVFASCTGGFTATMLWPPARTDIYRNGGPSKKP